MEELLTKILEEVRETKEQQAETNRLLKEQQSFWSKVVNDEFLKEFVENNENLKNKLG